MKYNKLLLTTSFMLLLGALSPVYFWHKKHDFKRIPSSVEAEQVSLEERKPALVEDITVITEERKDEAKKEDQAVSCQKDEANKLEDELKKLMADKESILKELNDLKLSAKNDKEKDKKDKTKKDDKAPAPQLTENQQMLMIMSNLSSLMISQQQQQQMLMMQMFSMLQNQQVSSDPLAEYYSPYAFRHDQFTSRFTPAFHNAFANFPNGFSGYNIGLSSGVYGSGNESQNFTPGPFGYGNYAPMNSYPSFGTSYPAMGQNPQAQPVAHDGFNFAANQGSNDNSNFLGNNFQRIDF